MDLQSICGQVCALAKETGKYLKSEVNGISFSDVETKGLNDFVTHVDKNSERRIIEVLKEVLPEAGFIAEEKTIANKGMKYTWVIDPLDGTTNYIHGIPCYAISIALMEHEQVILGVVLEVNQDECFYSWKDADAFLNGKEIFVSSRSKVVDSILATGFPYYNYDDLDKYMKLFTHFLKHSHGLRRLGSAAVDLAYVACGRFEGFFEYGLSPWDVAAGSFIIQQAGGKVYDFTGGKNYIFGKQIVASNSAISKEFNGVVQSAFHS